MKTFGYAIAALGAIAVAAPSIASAETTIIRHRDHDRYGARAEYREHREFREHRDRLGVFACDRDRLFDYRPGGFARSTSCRPEWNCWNAPSRRSRRRVSRCL